MSADDQDIMLVGETIGRAGVSSFVWRRSAGAKGIGVGGGGGERVRVRIRVSVLG